MRSPTISIREHILQQIADIAHQQRKALKPLTDGLPLLESGLDSLCLAVLVANLDDELGLDPFGAEGKAEFPVTIGDFIGLYESASS